MAASTCRPTCRQDIHVQPETKPVSHYSAFQFTFGMILEFGFDILVFAFGDAWGFGIWVLSFGLT